MQNEKHHQAWLVRARITHGVSRVGIVAGINAPVVCRRGRGSFWILLGNNAGMPKGRAVMGYEPPLNDPDFYEDEAEELSPEFDTLEELEGEN